MKQPMTSPAVPAKGASPEMTPKAGRPPGNNSTDTMGSGAGRGEAFSRGHTGKVSTPAQAHHIAKTKGGNGC